MISCRDVNNLQMDGMELVAGAAGLDRIVSWTYLVQTKPYKDHMNPGNFALLVVDYKRFSMDEAYDAMVELNELGISGFAISVVEDREEAPQRMKDKADELKLPLFYIRWEGATFVDIAQSVGELLLETSVDNKRTGDYLYNLLFGYEVNDKYSEKGSARRGRGGGAARGGPGPCRRRPAARVRRSSAPRPRRHPGRKALPSVPRHRPGPDFPHILTVRW